MCAREFSLYLTCAFIHGVEIWDVVASVNYSMHSERKIGFVIFESLISGRIKSSSEHIPILFRVQTAFGKAKGKSVVLGVEVILLWRN